MSKIEEKIDKAAREYFLNEVVEGDAIDDKSSWMDCFEAGADFALSHQWVSVEDALPEDDEEVFVSLVNGNQTTFVAIAWYSKADNGTRRWFSHDNVLDLGLIRYWMPIPPLPEARKEGEA